MKSEVMSALLCACRSTCTVASRSWPQVSDTIQVLEANVALLGALVTPVGAALVDEETAASGANITFSGAKDQFWGFHVIHGDRPRRPVHHLRRPHTLLEPNQGVSRCSAPRSTCTFTSDPMTSLQNSSPKSMTTSLYVDAAVRNGSGAESAALQ